MAQTTEPSEDDVMSDEHFRDPPPPPRTEPSQDDGSHGEPFREPPPYPPVLERRPESKRRSRNPVASLGWNGPTVPLTLEDTTVLAWLRNNLGGVLTVAGGPQADTRRRR